MTAKSLTWAKVVSSLGVGRMCDNALILRVFETFDGFVKLSVCHSKTMPRLFCPAGHAGAIMCAVFVSDSRVRVSVALNNYFFIPQEFILRN